MCYAGQSVAGPGNEQPSSVSTVIQADLSPPLETAITPSLQVKTTAKYESVSPPKIDLDEGVDGAPSTDMLCQSTDSALDITKLPTNNHVKGSLSRDIRWDTPPRPRANRTEAERIREFQADLHVAAIEPVSDKQRRLLCARVYHWCLVVSCAVRTL